MEQNKCDEYGYAFIDECGGGPAVSEWGVWVKGGDRMKRFKTNDIEDGLFAVFPTVILRRKRNMWSLGLWWGLWGCRVEWRELGKLF